ncbi:helix-turn-helix domain-containing protein [Zhongshania sp.]|uniref:terminase small subunit-like protein n=1 Tax=Zhongshania sp. TaxID=1971902 RepID=UPI00356AFCA3
MPAGRPTKYDPKYCDEVVEYMRDGYSVTAFAGHIGVARSTVFKWADEHEEFSDSLKAAQAMAAQWWEDRLRDVAMTGTGNATAAIFGVKNRSSEDYKDKRETDLTNSDGKLTPQVVERVIIDPKDTD